MDLRIVDKDKVANEAEATRMNASPMCEAKRWRKENEAAIVSSNEYVERHGLPLARFQCGLID